MKKVWLNFKNRAENQKLSEQIAKLKIEVEQCATRDQGKSDIIIKPKVSE